MFKSLYILQQQTKAKKESSRKILGSVQAYAAKTAKSDNDEVRPPFTLFDYLSPLGYETSFCIRGRGTLTLHLNCNALQPNL